VVGIVKLVATSQRLLDRDEEIIRFRLKSILEKKRPAWEPFALPCRMTRYHLGFPGSKPPCSRAVL